MMTKKTKWIVWYKYDNTFAEDCHEFQDTVHCSNIFEALYTLHKIKKYYRSDPVFAAKLPNFEIKLYKV